MTVISACEGLFIGEKSGGDMFGGNIRIHFLSSLKILKFF